MTEEEQIGNAAAEESNAEVTAGEEVTDGQTTEAAETQETEQTDDGRKSQWDELVPHLAGHYDSIAPEVREKILMARAAAAPSGPASTEDAPDGQSSTQKPPSAAPSLEELPQLDPTETRKALDAAIEEGDLEKASRVLAGNLQDMCVLYGMLQRQVAHMDTQMTEMGGEIRDVGLPAQFERALATVPGVEKADIPSALSIFRKGEAKTPEAALKIAAWERQTAQPKSRRTATSEAKRKAGSISASRAGGQSRPTGGPVGRIPVTEQEWSDYLQAEEAASR